MFIDASAMVAILGREPDWAELLERVGTAPRVFTSPIALYETVLAIARIRRITVDAAQEYVQLFLKDIGAQIIPIDAAIGTLALDAFTRYGKGRHPAALNMGDCFAYAAARSRDLSILAKGEDFSKTDITLA